MLRSCRLALCAAALTAGALVGQDPTLRVVSRQGNQWLGRCALHSPVLDAELVRVSGSSRWLLRYVVNGAPMVIVTVFGRSEVWTWLDPHVVCGFVMVADPVGVVVGTSPPLASHFDILEFEPVPGGVYFQSITLELKVRPNYREPTAGHLWRLES